MTERPSFSFVAAGELLVDFVSTEPCTPLAEARAFGKFFGGAPANVAVNMKNLGVSSTVVSKVGADGLGEFLISSLAAIGIDPRYVTRHASLPTSIVVVTSNRTPPEFVAYRQADTGLASGDIPDALLAGCEIFHTTAHGIARKTTQDAILDAYRRAAALGKITSFDPNYATSFWPNRDEAIAVMREFFRATTFCKPSLDDGERIMGTRRPDEIIDRFHEWGVKNVILTCGAEGAIFSSIDSSKRVRVPAIPTPDLVDATGAGDAFTAGFFATYLKTKDSVRSMQVGIRTATFSLRHLSAIAPLPRVEEFW